MLIPRGSLDAFTSRAAAHLGLPCDIVAYPGITLVDLNEAGVSFIRGEPGMVSRFFRVRAEHVFVLPSSPASTSDSESQCRFCNQTI
jgi:hypothetical protein